MDKKYSALPPEIRAFPYFLLDRFLVISPIGVQRTFKEEGMEMAEIKWETDFAVALDKAKKKNKPIFLDFWFDG